MTFHELNPGKGSRFQASKGGTVVYKKREREKHGKAEYFWRNRNLPRNLETSSNWKCCSVIMVSMKHPAKYNYHIFSLSIFNGRLMHSKALLRSRII